MREGCSAQSPEFPEIYSDPLPATRTGSFSRPWNSPPPIRLIPSNRMETAMLVERIVQILNVEIVGEAYDIASYHLRKTRQMPDDARIDQRLAELIYSRFASGVRNRLLLANKAISKFERRR